MSTIGMQEAISVSADGAWEMVGNDMIRTKRAPDGSGGMIVAQFWTTPTPEHAAMMKAAPEMLKALKDVRKLLMAASYTHCDEYAPIVAAIAKAEGRS